MHCFELPEDTNGQREKMCVCARLQEPMAFKAIAIACPGPGFETRTTVVIMAQASSFRSHRRIRITCLEMKDQTAALGLAQVEAMVS